MSGPFGSSQWMYSSGFYNGVIGQSVRLSITDGSFASITPSSAGDRQKFTFSTWLKRSRVDGTFQRFFCAEGDGGNESAGIRFDSSERLDFIFLTDGSDSITGRLITNRVFRDTSSWYHILLAQDTTQGTAGNRLRLYVNGVEETSFATDTNPTQNHNGQFGATVIHRIGAECHTGAQNFDGYMAETNYVDGQQLTPSSFGETKGGVWIPIKYTGSYGTTGFRLTYSDTSSNNALVSDSSGNGNDLTANGIVAGHDFTKDSPENNFCSIAPALNVTESQGNLLVTTSRTGNWDGGHGTIAVNSGKWYYEAMFTIGNSDNFRTSAGWIAEPENQSITLNGKGSGSDPTGTLNYQYSFAPWLGAYYANGQSTGTSPTSMSSGQVLNVAVDFDNNKIYFGINGTYYANDGGSDGDPAGGSNESVTLAADVGLYSPYFKIRSDGTTGSNVIRFNFGQEAGFSGQVGAGTETDGNGNGRFKYAVPSGFLALCTANLPDTTISPAKATQATDYFNTVLYTGNGGGTQSITGVGFQPDFTWLKGRSDADYHFLVDSVRGYTKRLFSNLDDGESTASTTISSSDSDGFTVGSDAMTNRSSSTYVAWNWLAGGSASSDSNGSITSSVSANTTAGFSIVTYTGDGGGSATIGHGLGVAPSLIIVKARTEPTGGVHFGTDQGNWVVYVKPPNGIVNETDGALLNKTDDFFDSAAAFNDTAPTSTVFTIGTADDVNESGDTYVAYCFANVDGYCKIGSYLGNGNADGPTILTGFRPAWIIFKDTDTDGTNWWMFDNKRSPFNLVNDGIIAQGSDAEFANNSNLQIDFLSNGFKHRTGGYDNNTSASPTIYMAFAEAPFKFGNAR